MQRCTSPCGSLRPHRRGPNRARCLQSPESIDSVFRERARFLQAFVRYWQPPPGQEPPLNWVPARAAFGARDGRAEPATKATNGTSTRIMAAMRKMITGSSNSSYNNLSVMRENGDCRTVIDVKVALEAVIWVDTLGVRSRLQSLYSTRARSCRGTPQCVHTSYFEWICRVAGAGYPGSLQLQQMQNSTGTHTTAAIAAGRPARSFAIAHAPKSNSRAHSSFLQNQPFDWIRNALHAGLILHIIKWIGLAVH